MNTDQTPAIRAFVQARIAALESCPRDCYAEMRDCAVENLIVVLDFCAGLEKAREKLSELTPV